MPLPRSRGTTLAGLSLAALIALHGTARASGFLLYEQSASALAKGSAVVASIHEPSAAWFNPAALAFLPSYGAAVSAGLLTINTSFTPTDPGPVVTSGDSPQLVPSLFGHVALTDDIQLGLAALAPYGLSIGWPEGWAGAQQSLGTDLRIIAVNPSLSYRISDHFALAAGFSILRGTVGLALALPPPPEGRAVLRGDAWGFAWNVAALYRLAADQLHIGVSYRRRAHMPFRGRADFSPKNPEGYEESLADQNAKADINLPDLVGVGVMVHPHPQLELSAQVDWVLWSAFGELVLDFEKPVTPDLVIQRSNVDPITARLGGEWAFADSGFILRAGTSFDQSSSRPDRLSPSTPDAQRVGACGGIGYRVGHVSFDLGYMYAYFLPAESTALPKGTYRSAAHVLALAFGVWGDPAR